MDIVSNGNNNPASTIYIGNLDPRCVHILDIKKALYNTHVLVE